MARSVIPLASFPRFDSWTFSFYCYRRCCCPSGWLLPDFGGSSPRVVEECEERKKGIPGQRNTMAEEAVSERVRRGQCLCGDIRFTVRGAPLWVVHCHCLSCRRNTGAPVTTFAGFAEHQVQFIGNRSFFASSSGVSRGFCARCGTPVSYQAERFPGEIHLYISAFEDPEDLPAERHVHYDERVRWLHIADDLPRR